MQKKNREIKLIFTVLAVFFAAFLAVPMIQVLMKSVLSDEGAGVTFANYVEVLTGKDFLQALGNSFVVSACSAVLTTILAFSLPIPSTIPMRRKGIKD